MKSFFKAIFGGELTIFCLFVTSIIIMFLIILGYRFDWEIQQYIFSIGIAILAYPITSATTIYLGLFIVGIFDTKFKTTHIIIIESMLFLLLVIFCFLTSDLYYICYLIQYIACFCFFLLTKIYAKRNKPNEKYQTIAFCLFALSIIYPFSEFGLMVFKIMFAIMSVILFIEIIRLLLTNRPNTKLNHKQQ